MIYLEVDVQLVPWAEAKGFFISKEFGGAERRFFYVSGGVHECYQISVEPPVGRQVTVNAWSVETSDDKDFHESWVVPLAALRTTLDAALTKINEWAGRKR